MRKKLLPAICCALLFSNSTYATEQTLPVESFFEYTNGSQSFTYNGHKLTTDDNGDTYLELHFTFANNSYQFKYFYSTFNVFVKQNNQNLRWFDQQQPSFASPSLVNNSTRALKDGETVNLAYYIKLDDLISPLELTVLDASSHDYLFTHDIDLNDSSEIYTNFNDIPSDYDSLLNLYLTLLDKYTSLYTQTQDTNVSPTVEEKTVGYITTEDYIQALLRSYVSDYDYTTIDSITINDDAGTDTPDDYIALVNLTWSQKNSQETTEKMLDMYSQDMAARIYKDSSNVQEICIFWNVPYLNASAKWSFERGSNGMYATDQIFSN